MGERESLTEKEGESKRRERERERGKQIEKERKGASQIVGEKSRERKREKESGRLREGGREREGGSKERGGREKTVGDVKLLHDTLSDWVNTGVALIRRIRSSPLDETKSNIQAEEMKAFNTLRNRIDNFSFTFSDKQKT